MVRTRPWAAPCAAVRDARHGIADAIGQQVGDSFTLLARTLGQLGVGNTAPGTSLRNDADALDWFRVEVDGRTVIYGAGGSGPPVLFLHGWALGSHTYKRALRRLVARGCRVIAPAMPGFGGSGSIPLPKMTIPAYAEWASRFLDEIGVEEPAVVIGHSFGGGVAASLAHVRPDQVRYLVLANAVGGAAWDGRGSSLSDRPLWEWARSFGRDMVGPDSIEMFGAMSQDLLTNVLTNPLVLVRAGLLAKDADLTDELAELRDHDIPVLALTSERDDVIPSAAFETLCSALGAEGRVVRGGHSWVLADPDHFADVLQNVIDVEVSDHRSSSAAVVADRVRELLEGTAIPAPTADDLVDAAPPLWLLSDAPAGLAADLALCHPPLDPGEVRAVAHPLAGSDDLRLTVVAPDRAGLLADTAAALTEEGLQITSASAVTWPAGPGRSTALAVHSMTVEPPFRFGPDDFAALGDRLRTWRAADTPPFRPLGRATVEVGGLPERRATITITGRDQPGLLWAICAWFADRGVSIESVHATTNGPVARDDFIVVGDFDPDALATHLSTSPRDRSRRPARV